RAVERRRALLDAAGALAHLVGAQVADLGEHAFVDEAIAVVIDAVAGLVTGGHARARVVERVDRRIHLTAAAVTASAVALAALEAVVVELARELTERGQ